MLARGAGVGDRAELFELRVEGGAEQILFATGQLIEELPEEIEVGAGSIVERAIAAQGAP